MATKDYTPSIKQQAMRVPTRAAPALKPLRVTKVTPEVAESLSRCVDEGLRIDQTIDRVEVETGVRLQRAEASIQIRAVQAARLDALRLEVPDFKGDNIARCDYYATEVAALGSTFRGLDADRYLKFSAELRQWVLLQERIRTQQLQATQQNLTINVNDDASKQALTSKLARLIERSGEGSGHSAADPSGSDPAALPLGSVGEAEPTTPER